MATSALLLTGIVLFFVLRFIPIETIAKSGRCYFSTHFKMYCPGCGGTRAVSALVRGDILDSILSNPIPVYALVLLLRMWAALLYNTAIGKGKEIRVLYDWEAWGILAVVLGHFILRNVLLVLFQIDYLGDFI